MTTQVLSVNIDTLKWADRKRVCGIIIEQIKQNRSRLHPSKYGWRYGSLTTHKELVIANKPVAKNATLILFGKWFEALLARASDVVRLDRRIQQVTS